MRALQDAVTAHPVVSHPLFREVFATRRIDAVAPASGVHSSQLEALRKQLAGFNLNLPAVMDASESVFHSNPDAIRFEQLVAALYDDTPDGIIWTLRGGYGSARLLEQLHALTPPAQEKTVIGFSDNTALHVFLSQHWHWRTVHGPGLLQLLNPDAHSDNFLRLAEIIGKKVRQQTFLDLKPLNVEAEQVGCVSGHLQGGNLTLIENSIGTFWQAHTAGCVLFLEEIGEKGYRIDRSLYHLKQAGMFAAVHAVVLGDCLGPDAREIEYALHRFAKDTPVPVYQTAQFGHGNMNYPIQYRAPATILRTQSGDTVLTFQLC